MWYIIQFPKMLYAELNRTEQHKVPYYGIDNTPSDCLSNHGSNRI